MSDEVWIYRIALTLVHGVGTAIHRQLLDVYGTERTVLDASAADLCHYGLSGVLANRIVTDAPKVIEAAKRELDFMAKNNVTPIYFADDVYPYRLQECKDSPIILYCKGPCPLDAPKLLAVVGTRRMTDYGRQCTQQLIADLASRHPEMVIVSGLAYGVDGCAHQAALDNGLRTMAVMGTSQRDIYPHEHRLLASKMIEHGGLLTEFSSQVKTDRGGFVSRNRIIAGLSDAVLVAESGIKGGALLTADFANSYSRDVFAFPGRIGDELSAGCNNLISHNKAALVMSADDIDYQMNWTASSPKKEGTQTSLFPEVTETGLTDVERQIIVLIRQHERLQIDELAKLLDMPVGKLHGILFQMEFNQLVHQLPGDVYAIGK